ANPDMELATRRRPENVDSPLNDDPGVDAVRQGSGKDARRSRPVEVGPERREDVVRAGRIRSGGQVTALVVLGAAAADDGVTVRVDPDPRPRLAGIRERRDVEVDDLLIADRDRCDAERVERDVPEELTRCDRRDAGLSTR